MSSERNGRRTLGIGGSVRVSTQVDEWMGGLSE